MNKNRLDLLEELNAAMAEIQDEDPYFNEKISRERIYNTKTNALLAPKQEDWIAEHGEIRVGYRENYLPFCSKDDKTGELTGALKDYLARAKNNLNSPNLEFKAIPFDSTDEALSALEAGEIDCVFPVCLSTYDADQRGLRLTESAMKTEMNAIMRVTDHQGLSKDSKITFAVNANMLNIETFIMDCYPEAERVPYHGLEACYEAVSSHEADCVLVSNYRIPSEENTLNKYKLYSVPTGETLTFSFAVRKNDREMYFLLNKTVLTTKTEEMDAALASYMFAEQKTSFLQFLKDNLLLVLAILTVIFAVILFLLGQKLRAERLYSAILMDVRMPEMDGLEATKAIRAMKREDAKRIPIIALTANAFDEDVQRSLQAGMNAHLNKPVEADHLIRILGELIYEAEESMTGINI